MPGSIYYNENKYATVELIQVTNYYWATEEFTAPGCVAVYFEPAAIEAADIEYHHDEDNLTAIAEGWGNGQESCVAEDQDGAFGHYQINKARAVGLVAWYEPASAPQVNILAPLPITATCMTSTACRSDCAGFLRHNFRRTRRTRCRGHIQMHQQL